MYHLITFEPEQWSGHPDIGVRLTSAESTNLIDLLHRVRDALGTAEIGDALVEVARNAHRAEQKLASLTRELDEARNELEEDFDITESGGPNKAMRLANMIDEALYGPGGY